MLTAEVNQHFWANQFWELQPMLQGGFNHFIVIYIS